MAGSDASGATRLDAYVVADERRRGAGRRPSPLAPRAAAAARWSRRRSRRSTALPLTPSGKVDRRALPAPASADSGRARATVAPARRGRGAARRRLGGGARRPAGRRRPRASSTSAAIRCWRSACWRGSRRSSAGGCRCRRCSSGRRSRTWPTLLRAEPRLDRGPWSPLVPIQPEGDAAAVLLRPPGRRDRLLLPRAGPRSSAPTARSTPSRRRGWTAIARRSRVVEEMAACYVDGDPRGASPRGRTTWAAGRSAGWSPSRWPGSLPRQGQEVGTLALLDAWAPTATGQRSCPSALSAGRDEVAALGAARRARRRRRPARRRCSFWPSSPATSPAEFGGDVRTLIEHLRGLAARRAAGIIC